MANPLQEPKELNSGGIGARLRALRHEHPSLAVLTEMIQLDERRVTFRATVSIDGEPRAQGHAARSADSAGNFIAAAERLAVEQALLLGGFAAANEESPTVADRAGRLAAMPPVTQARPDEGSDAPDDSPPAPAPRRRRRVANTVQSNVPPADKHEPGPAPEVPGADAEIPSITLASPPHTVADETTPAEPPKPLTPPAASADEDAVGATGAPAETPPAPRPKRDRRAERTRARLRQSGDVREARADAGTGDAGGADTIPSGTATRPPAPENAQAPSPERSPVPTAAPESPPATARRRPRSRATAAPQTTPVPTAPTPDAPTGREAVRAAWRVGRPIPAWWPPDRTAVEKPLTKTQVERLRAVALDEEMTATQLDSYSTLLFGRGVAELHQAQGTILEERLNPAYPSPLQELSARRVLFPIAVGDTVTIPDGQPAFIRWRDVPPIEETPESPAPITPSWRAGGTKGGGKRRR